MGNCGLARIGAGANSFVWAESGWFSFLSQLGWAVGNGLVGTGTVKLGSGLNPRSRLELSEGGLDNPDPPA